MQFPHSVTPVRRLFLTRGRVFMERAALSLLLGVMASTAAATAAAAQDDEDSGSLPPSFVQMIQAAMSKSKTAAKAVTVTPAVVTIDPKVNTATFQLINSSTDSVSTTLKVQNDAPSQAAGDAATGGASNAKGDAAKPSLASWIKDLPEKVKLAPQEKRTVTVHVTAPAGLPSGTYTAYVVGITEPVINGQTATLTMSGSETPFITSKLVYQAP